MPVEFRWLRCHPTTRLGDRSAPVYWSIAFANRTKVLSNWTRSARLRLGRGTLAQLFGWCKVQLLTITSRSQVSSKVLPPRIQRLAWRLHQHDFRIAHISGNANTADSLSRLPSKGNHHSDSGFCLWRLASNYSLKLQSILVSVTNKIFSRFDFDRQLLNPC